MSDLSSVITIELWPTNIHECPLCGVVDRIDHAVAYCCGPTHDEIGSESSEYAGCTVGGMCCCKSCHDKHYGVA